MRYWFNKNKGIRLYNGDCLEVMDNLIKMGVRVDLIICDPAYPTTSRGNAGTSGGMCQSREFKEGKVFEHNSTSVKTWMPKAYELLKDGSHCYIMTNHVNLIEYLNVAKECGFHFIKSLIWNKGNKIMGQFYMSQFEYILFFRKGKAKRINNCGTSDIFDIPNKKQKDERGKNLHDTEKPVDLMRILVENSSNKGDLVLDFMCGINATGVACQELGRRYIGIELDEKYFNISIDRIKEANDENNKN